MSTLYEITGEYLQLLEMMENSEEYDEQALKDTLEGVEGELEIKAENYAKIIKEIEAEAVKFEEEKRRLEERASTLKNRSKVLKDHLLFSMQATGKRKFKSGLFNFSISKNGGLQPMEINTELKIPDEYMKKEPDPGKIRDALKSGKVLPFAVLKERGEHLSIR